MTMYSFHPQFVEAIRKGKKTHTIRAPRKGKAGHARPGQALQLYTGPRMRPKKLGDAVCKEVWEVILDFEWNKVSLHCLMRENERLPGDSKLLFNPEEVEAFAKTDGFKSWAQMRAFWAQRHKVTDRWTGLMICWRDFTPTN